MTDPGVRAGGLCRLRRVRFYDSWSYLVDKPATRGHGPIAHVSVDHPAAEKFSRSANAAQWASGWPSGHSAATAMNVHHLAPNGRPGLGRAIAIRQKLHTAAQSVHSFGGVRAKINTAKGKGVFFWLTAIVRSRYTPAERASRMACPYLANLFSPTPLTVPSSASELGA